MRKIAIILFAALLSLSINAQSILIDKTNPEYVLNEHLVNASNKTCKIINCFYKEYTDCGNQSIRPLGVFKIFDFSTTIVLKNYPPNITKVENYVKGKIIPKLCLDMNLEISSLNTSNIDQNIQTFDSLIIFDGTNYSLIKGGVITLEFFNVVSFKQLHLMQTNQSIFNIDAIIPKIINWTRDSIPTPNVDALTGGKMFLLRKRRNDYTFFCSPFMCADCPLTFYNEYVYRKDFGVIAFKSKYLFIRQGEFRTEKIGESNDYFYFR